MNELPRDIEIEKTTLGALIIDPNKIDLVSTILTASDFYKELHQKIYEIILQIHNAEDNEVDLATVNTKMMDMKITSASYLANMVNSVPTAENVKYYAKKVKDLSVRRSVIKNGSMIQQLGYDTSKKVDEVINKSEEMLFSLSDSGNEEDSCLISEELLSHLDDIEERTKSKGITGLKTPWRKLNKATAGLQPGDLIIIAARPSMGKTALALNLADYTAVKQGLPVSIFSAEMSRKKLMDRFLAMRAGVNGLRLKNGQLEDKDWRKISTAGEELRNTTIQLIGNSVRKVNEIKSRARRAKRELDIQLMIVDFLQLLSGFEDQQSRNRQIGEMTKAFKSLAGELDIPVVLLAQLSRSVEQRSNKRPLLSDLRDSGEIEEYTDICMLLYRDDYYNPDSDKNGIMEVNLAKNRDGKTGTLELGFRKAKQRVLELSRRSDQYA